MKEVLYADVPFLVDMDRGTAAQREPVPVYTLDRPDRLALECALRLRDCAGYGQVTTFTIGPIRASTSMYGCLAMGADKVVHVVDDHADGLNSRLIARMLASAVRGTDFDLILCGNRSSDVGACQVPQTLAELLDLPQVTGAVSMEVIAERKQVRATRKLEHGDRQIVECPLPAVISVEPALNEPRYVSLHSVQTALRERANDYTLDSDTADVVKRDYCGGRTARFVAPRPPAKRTPMPDPNSSAADRLRFVMTGGVSDRKSDLIVGTASEMVQQLLAVLQREGFPGTRS